MASKEKIVTFAILLAATALQAQSPVPTGKPSTYPAWWFERDVIERTNPDSAPEYPDDYPAADDYAALLQGQLKSIGSKAYAEMVSALPASIWSTTEGDALEAMVNGWLSDTTAGDNYAVINAGQLKNVAVKFYDVLNEAGYASGLNLPPTTWATGTYPWSPSTADDDNYAAALLGQAKNLFSFDLKRSVDGDQVPDWWESKYGLPSGSDGAADSDGDGTTNLGEYTAWSNPVDYYSRPTALSNVRIVLVSGNDQPSRNNSYLEHPLVFKVLAGTDTILKNAPVQVAVSNGDGGLSLTEENSTVTAAVDFVTDGATGLATVYYRQGATANSDVMIGLNAGPAPPEHFTVNEPYADISFELVSGDRQGVRVGEWTWRPTIVRAKDLSGNSVPFAPLQVIVESSTLGGVSISKSENPVAALSLTADNEGLAQFWFKAANLPAAPIRIYVHPPGHPENKGTIQMAARHTNGLPPVTDGLIALYSGEHTTDDSWGLNHASNNGAGYVSGWRGQGFDLDGAAGFIETPVKSGAERTLMAWIKARSFSDVPVFAPVIDSSTSVDIGNGFGLDDGMIKVSVDDQVWETGEQMALGEWGLVALVVNDHEAKLYLNGILKQTFPYTQEAVNDITYRVGRTLAGSAAFDGLVDELALYDRALPDYEIYQLFQWYTTPPVANPKIVGVSEDRTVEFELSGVSPRGDALNIIQADSPTHGTLSQTGSKFKYVPDLNYTGEDGFSFRVDDLVTQSEPAQVTINVIPENDVPWVMAGANQSVLMSQGANLSGTVVDVDSGVQALTYTWTLVSGPGSATFANATALATIVMFDQIGDYVLRLSASDGKAFRSDTVRIHVSADHFPSVVLSIAEIDSQGRYQDSELTLTASVPNGGIGVEFYEGSRLIGESSGGTFVWKNFPFNSYKLTAAVVFADGTRSFSNAVNVFGFSDGVLAGAAGNSGSVDISGSSGTGSVGIAEGEDSLGGSDVDGDGLSEFDEEKLGSDPSNTDSDEDGIADGTDVHPTDRALRWKKTPDWKYVAVPISTNFTVASVLALGENGEILAESADNLHYWTLNAGWATLNSTVPVTFKTKSVVPGNIHDLQTSTGSLHGIDNCTITRNGEIFAGFATVSSSMSPRFIAGGAAKWSDSSASPTTLEPVVLEYNEGESSTITAHQIESWGAASKNGAVLIHRKELNFSRDGSSEETVINTQVKFPPSTTEENTTVSGTMGESNTGQYYYFQGPGTITSSGYCIGIPSDGNGPCRLYSSSGSEDLAAVTSAISPYLLEAPSGEPILCSVEIGGVPGDYVKVDGSWIRVRSNGWLPQFEELSPESVRFSKCGVAITRATQSRLWMNGRTRKLANATDYDGELRALDINDKGMILCEGKKSGSSNIEPVLLIPFQILGCDPESGRVSPVFFEVASNPIPEVDFKVLEIRDLPNGNIEVDAKISVKDRISELVSSGKVDSIKISVNGEEIEEIGGLAQSAQQPSQVGWREHEFVTSIDRTIEVPFDGKDDFPSIRVETGKNAVGNKGWIEKAFSFHPEVDLNTLQVSDCPVITLPASFSDTSADSIHVSMFGVGFELAESNEQPNSLCFQGTITNSGTTFPAVLRLKSVGGDIIKGTLSYINESAQEVFTNASWTRDTGSNTFRVLEPLESVKITYAATEVKEERRSEHGGVFPYMVRLADLPENFASALTIKVGGSLFSLRKETMVLPGFDPGGLPGLYAAEENRVKLWASTSLGLDESVASLGPQPNAPIVIQLKLGDELYDMRRIGITDSSEIKPTKPEWEPSNE